MHKNENRGPVLGASSLLVIFAVLCLTVFSLLSISTARANGRLSETARDAVTAYYRADAQAERILARLRAGESIEGVQKENDIYSYGCTISPTQVLWVELALDGSDYRILRWQAVSTAQWEADDRLPVWDGS